MARLLVLLLILTGAPALACPQAMDPVNGIVLTRDAPFFSVFMLPGKDGLGERRVMTPHGRPEAVKTIYPHPLLVGRQADDSGALSLDYAAPAAGLRRLPQTGIWASDVVLKTDGRVTGRGVATIAFVEYTTTWVGDCEYGVWRVDDRLELEGRPPILFEKYYAPQLGLVLRAIRLEPDRTPRSEVSFDRIEVGENF